MTFIRIFIESILFQNKKRIKIEIKSNNEINNNFYSLPYHVKNSQHLNQSYQ